MLIGIDASRANKPQKTGVEWYSYHLIEGFKKIDKDNHYFLYTNVPLRGELVVCPPNFEEKVLSWLIPRSWTLARLSYEMKFGKEIPDVLFVPAHTIPLLNPKRSIVTVHDIGFEHFPEVYPWADKLYHKFTIRFIKRFASKIIAVSHYTKEDLVKTYGIDKEKIVVIHNGYDRAKYEVLDRNEEFSKKHKLDFPYLLFIGRLEQKKNIPRLIDAFAEFKKRNKTAHKLVLIGRPGFGYDEVEKKIKKYGLTNEVVMPGWVGDDELPKFLNQAELFVFPSLFEGFGIPVIEAMACGCPVICSNTTSLPEVAGEAALMFDPEKPEEIVSRMEQVLLNPEVQESLKIKGLRQAEQFSWEKCAAETLRVLLGFDNNNVMATDST